MSRISATTIVAALALFPSSSAKAQSSVETTNVIGRPFTHVVKLGDTLGSLASRFGVESAALARVNGLVPNTVIKPGQSLLVDNRHIVPAAESAQIIVNVPQRMLYFLDGQTVVAFPVALGRPDWKTPRGRFTVLSKEENPTWDVPASIQEEMRRQGKPVIEHMPPSPQNPLGAHWIGLSLSNVGIHGTIAPLSIYRFVSHGCIRLHPDDVAALFPQVRVGMAGAIIYQPVLMTVTDGRVLVEVHRDAYHLGPSPMAYLRSLASRDSLEDSVDWTRVAAAIGEHAGIPVDVTRAE